VSNRTIKTCSIDGCNSKSHGRGYCNKHYLRWWRLGDPQIVKTPIYATPEESFAARTEWQGNCLIWTGTSSSGYGSLRVNGKMRKAHRYAWERVNGPIPDGLFIDHMCYNRLCVNPDHLRPATRSQNGSNRSSLAKTSATSGVRNVSWDKKNRKWRVRTRKNGELQCHGWYERLEEAAEVAKSVRAERFGNFAGQG